MAVVAIVGILAVLAIPEYLKYTARSKVAELEQLAGACKTSVAEYFQAHKRLPANIGEAGCSGLSTRYAKATAVSDGVVSIEAQNIVVGDVDGKFLALRPYCGGVACDTLAVPGPVTSWRCDAAGAPTTIDAAYLPAPCR
jgi:type IV pilus assembly protein PilA